MVRQAWCNMKTAAVKTRLLPRVPQLRRRQRTIMRGAAHLAASHHLRLAQLFHRHQLARGAVAADAHLPKRALADQLQRLKIVHAQALALRQRTVQGRAAGQQIGAPVAGMPHSMASVCKQYANDSAEALPPTSQVHSQQAGELRWEQVAALWDDTRPALPQQARTWRRENSRSRISCSASAARRCSSLSCEPYACSSCSSLARLRLGLTGADGGAVGCDYARTTAHSFSA